MELIIATQNFPPAPGGIERFSHELATAVSARWPRLTVLAPGQPNCEAYDSAVPYKVVRYRYWPSREFGLGKTLWPRLGDARALVCMQWTSALAAIVPWFRMTDRPLAIVGHGNELMANAKSLFAAELHTHLRSRVLQAATHVLANSAFTSGLAIAAGAHPDRVKVLHPGVDITRFRPRGRADISRYRQRDKGPYLLTVSRLVPRKGVDIVIEALAVLRAIFLRIRYLVAGDGPDRGRLEAMASQYGVAECVRFLGRVAEDELASLYSAADMFVLVSRIEETAGDVEGFGMVLLEAQACGIPVVIAGSGGMPEAILPGQSGEILTDSNPQTVSDTLLNLLDDSQRLALMGRCARAYAENHAWPAVAERLLSILELE